MAARHKTTQERAIDLPTGFNAWLLDCVPSPGCGVCAANMMQLQAAKKKGNMDQAVRHADEIRAHASGSH